MHPRTLLLALAAPALLCAAAALHQPLAPAQPAEKADDDRPFPLMPGDTAPPLDVAWFRPAGPSRSIEKGRPYIVEFWATWCVPCVANIPRLSALQEKYQDRLTVVGVSVWEPRPDEVEPFVKKQGDRMAYNAALDSCPPAPPGTDNPSDWAKNHGRCAQSWLRASGWSGIPVAFIVDREGRLAWAGDPRDLDEPLAAVIDGRWDTQAFLPKYRAQMTAELKARPIYQRRRAAAIAHDHNAFLQASQELLALGPTMAPYAAGTFRYMLVEMADPPRAYAFLELALGDDGIARDNRDALTDIAAIILEQAAKGDPAPEKKADAKSIEKKSAESPLDIALRAAQRAVKVTRAKEAGPLETLAAVHAARQEFAKAATYQQRAIDTALDEEKPPLQEKLNEYIKRAG